MFLKDKEYFEGVVRQFIQFKMEKTFVDHYLLGNYQILIEKYNTIHEKVKLNGLESCLLVDCFLKSNMIEEAKQLVEYIKIFRDNSENKDISSFNRLFDIVLNLNIMKDQVLKPSSEGAGGSFDPF